MTETTCSIDGCERPVKSTLYKLCAPHYTRKMRHGDPLAGGPMRAARPAGTIPATRPAHRDCSVDGCEKNQICRKLCAMHYSRWHRYGDPLAEGVHTKFAGQDFDELVDRTGGPDACHPWKGALDKQGYGRYRKVGALDERSHRESARRTYGPLPAKETGIVVDHRCHDPRTCPGGPSCPHRKCCNPAHLKLVQQSENASFDRNARFHWF